MTVPGGFRIGNLAVEEAMATVRSLLRSCRYRFQEFRASPDGQSLQY